MQSGRAALFQCRRVALSPLSRVARRDFLSEGDFLKKSKNPVKSLCRLNGCRCSSCNLSSKNPKFFFKKNRKKTLKNFAMSNIRCTFALAKRDRPSRWGGQPDFAAQNRPFGAQESA
ncbi:MAG: hypothetical protein IJU62_01885, partial [Muribaculaceae bacterium]|nr:hypothetical protein [Muribaculaceae bacterium]